MRYTSLIISIISIIFIFCFSFVSAQEIKEPAMPDWLNKIYRQIDQKVIRPVKQATQNLPENVEKSIKQLLEKLQQKKQEKQEEIKQEIKSEVKEEAKEWGQRAAERIKKFLAPLKSKIKQGSDIIRELIYKIKDFLIDLFKE
ncbi:MAG: hypothetical protein ISS88_02920 [Candidatus Portnoybacteria bacterium]|nr:hypothetical protein [Candidatus Portnoybacteria bacterium]